MATPRHPLLTRDRAAGLMRIALGHVRQDYPNKLDHVLGGPDDVQGPRALHPVFFGSFDWHSCVHSWWLLVRLARLFPDLPEAGRVRALADEAFAPAAVAGERAYLARPESAGFERPYGWGWLLALDREMRAGGDDRLGGLASDFAARFTGFLPRQTYPVRAGVHTNTAFALVLALPWARSFDPGLAALIARRSQDWYGADTDAPAWEPGGDEFLSATLVEALLMREVLAPEAFARWFAAFLPGLADGRPATLFQPAIVSDRTDGKIVHLDGFNLCRAWGWRTLEEHVPPVVRDRVAQAAEAHLQAGMGDLGGHYMGAHWLASFALLALAGV